MIAVAVRENDVSASAIDGGMVALAHCVRNKLVHVGSVQPFSLVHQ